MLKQQKIVITSPDKPTPDLQSEEGARNYYAKVLKLNRLDVCIELSNVMAAKHNKRLVPSGLLNYSENQTIVNDLTDKAAVICFVQFGQSTILEYGSGDLRQFNALVNKVDKEIAQQDLEPVLHGNTMLEILGERLKLDIPKA